MMVMMMIMMTMMMMVMTVSTKMMITGPGTRAICYWLQRAALSGHHRLDGDFCNFQNTKIHFGITCLTIYQNTKNELLQRIMSELLM